MKFVKVVKSMTRKEKDQIGALDDNAVGNYNLYQGQGEWYVTKHKLHNNLALMATTDTFEQMINLLSEDDHYDHLCFDKELQNEWENHFGFEIEIDPDVGGGLEDYHLYDLSNLYDNNTNKIIRTGYDKENIIAALALAVDDLRDNGGDVERLENIKDNSDSDYELLNALYEAIEDLQNSGVDTDIYIDILEGRK